jgi:hypothetical protein
MMATDRLGQTWAMTSLSSVLLRGLFRPTPRKICASFGSTPRAHRMVCGPAKVEPWSRATFTVYAIPAECSWRLGDSILSGRQTRRSNQYFRYLGRFCIGDASRRLLQACLARSSALRQHYLPTLPRHHPSVKGPLLLSRHQGAVK